MRPTDEAPWDVKKLWKIFEDGKAAARRGDNKACWNYFDRAEAVFTGVCSRIPGARGGTDAEAS